MIYYTVVIPREGFAFLKTCLEYNVGSEGYEIPAGSIGVSLAQRRLCVLIECQFQDLFTFQPANARIYAIDEINRDKFGGLEKQDAEQIVGALNERTWILWNRPPESESESE